MLAKESEQKEKITSLTKELEEANQSKDTWKESNRKASETQSDLRTRYNLMVGTYNSLVDKYSGQKETNASLKKQLEKVGQSKHSREESERRASEAQRKLQKALEAQKELQNRYDLLLVKDSEQKGEIASLTGDIKKANLSKHTYKESNRKALEAQTKLQNQYDSLLTKYSKSEGTITSLNGELEEAKQSMHTWKSETHNLREKLDDMGVKIALQKEEKKKASFQLDELRKAHESASDESATLGADRDSYREEAKQMQKAEADLKRCEIDLKHTKDQLVTLQSEPNYYKDYQEEMCKSRKLQEEKDEIEARLEKSEKENELNLHMWKRTWEATCCENENNKKALQQEYKTFGDLLVKVDILEQQLKDRQKEFDGQGKEWCQEKEGFEVQIANLKEAVERSNNLQGEVEKLHKQLDDRQKELDVQRNEWCHEKEGFEVQIANLKEAVERSNNLQGEVEKLHKQLDGQRKELHDEREASENRIGKLKVSCINTQMILKSMKEEHRAEMQKQRLSYDEDRSNDKMAAIASLKTQLEHQRVSLSEKHNATVEDLKENSKSEMDMLLSSCKTNAAQQAEEFNRQLKEEKEKVSKLADENQNHTRTTEFYQRALRGSQKSLEEAHKTINQLCLIAVIFRKKNRDSFAKREVILFNAIERAKTLETKLTALQDELNASQLGLTETQSTLERKNTEADAESKLLKETAGRLAQLHHLHSACAQNRRLQLGCLDRQTLLADFSDFTATLADCRRFRGKVSNREVEVCLGLFQGQTEAVCLIQGVEDQRCLQILQLAIGDCCVIGHCWKKWIRLGRDKPLYILVSAVDDKSWMERYLPKGLCSSEDLRTIG